MPDADQDDWKSLPEFTEVTKNYTDFQDAVYALYPGVTKDCEFTTTDVHRAIDEQLRVKYINDVNDYSRYYVKLRPMLANLLKKSRITNLEANQFLADALDPSLKPLITTRLLHAYSNRTADTPYTVEQFHQSTVYVFFHRNDDAEAIFRSPGSSSRTVGTPVAPAPVPVPATAPAPPIPQALPPIKQEDVKSLALLLQQQIAENWHNQGPPRDHPPHMRGGFGGYGGGPNYGRRPMRCYYCGKENCDTKTCPEVMDDIRAHKIRRERNQIVLYDGSPLHVGFNGQTMREQ
ncbi:hypothetical protein GSI_13697 [Ganoderma sinense ZZ0214-1]|uniref:Uncharacterized protein n=1 Tax=Ganoderma sinense ZZ0214-1 TaxID=1077348 RepID=A0A2G8RR06_9APHY|nr:hypothetical protein GSI_13697 [Ganoderma sinense ZZ0214-1]